MILINANELIVSIDKDIKIYSFDKIANKSFNVTLKGHTNLVSYIKLMNNSKHLLVSCTFNKDCTLWSISRKSCLKVFKRYSSLIGQ